MYADDVLLLLLIVGGVEGGDGVTGLWLLIVIARWSDGRLGDEIEFLFVVGSGGRRELTVDVAGTGIRLADVVDDTVGRDEDDTAAFSWFTIDLTRFLPCETDESISTESEYRFIIRKWKRICVYARAHTDAIRFLS